MERKKSAKDIAFEKERAKFLHEIRRLSELVRKQQKQIDVLNETVMEKDSVIRQQMDWIVMDHLQSMTREKQGADIKNIAKVLYAVCIQAGIYIPDEFLMDVAIAADILEDKEGKKVD